MSRKATSIEHELDQLKKRAPAPDFLSRKRSLYFKQVSDLASLLKPEVNRELGREASSDIATEWLELAKQALTSIAPELPQGLEQRREFKDAEEQVHKGLTEQFLKDALKTSEDEVDSHTRELAQCVLSNWISILEHAKQDNLGKTLSLSPNALPDSVDRNAIYEGVGAFVVPVNSVASKFMEYLELVRKTQAVVELAPALYLVQKSGAMHLASSEEEAKRLVAEPTRIGDTDKRDSPVRGSLKPVYDFLAPMLDSSPGFFGRTRKPAIVGPFGGEQMEQSLAVAAAYEAMLESGTYIETGTPDKSSYAMNQEQVEPREKISADLAEYAILDLDQALQTGTLANFVTRIRQRTVKRNLVVEVRSAISEEAFIPLCRMSVAATGYAVWGAAKKGEAVAFDLAEVKEFMEKRPKVHEYFNIAVHAARQALANPQARAIKIQMQLKIEDFDI